MHHQATGQLSRSQMLMCQMNSTSPKRNCLDNGSWMRLVSLHCASGATDLRQGYLYSDPKAQTATELG